jgi:hypothetical protein
VPGRGWYRGDCHVHSDRSTGGELTPRHVAAEARAAGLDFIAATEHNTSATHHEWGRQAGDDLLIILGQEVTTETGHWLALGLGPGQPPDRRQIGVVAHPHAPYPTGTFLGPIDGFDVIEVWNGPWTSNLPWQADNEAALADWGRGLAKDIHDGRWRPAMGNSDIHLAGQIGTQTVVLADDLSSQAILTGIRTGRSWLAESSSVQLCFDAAAGDNRAGIGERLQTEKQPAVVRLRVRGVPTGTVSFHTDRGKAHEEPLPADTVEWRTTAAESAFVRAEIRHPGGRVAALTNPVILR